MFNPGIGCRKSRFRAATRHELSDAAISHILTQLIRIRSGLPAHFRPTTSIPASVEAVTCCPGKNRIGLPGTAQQQLLERSTGGALYHSHADNSISGPGSRQQGTAVFPTVPGEISAVLIRVWTILCQGSSFGDCHACRSFQTEFAACTPPGRAVDCPLLLPTPARAVSEDLC